MAWQSPNHHPGFSLPDFPNPPEGDNPGESLVERKRRLYEVRGGGLILFVLLVVVLAAVLIYFDVPPLLTQGGAQMATVRQFCADEVQQDYAAAYTLLSSGYFEGYGVSEDEWAPALQQRNRTYGPVRACTITGRDYVGTVLSFGAGVFQVKVTLGDRIHTGDVTVVNDNGWKVNNMDTQLHLDG